MDITINKQVPHHTYKCVLLGASGSGKSSLVLRFQKNIFSEFSESTIGAAFSTKTIINKGEAIRLEIWDTAGQERYDSLMPMYYRGASIAYVTFDITNRDSYSKAKLWIKEIRKNTHDCNTIVLIGNKSDLDENRNVRTDEAKKYCEQEDLLYIETSAKTGFNVNKAFTLGCEKTYIKMAEMKNNLEDRQHGERVVLEYNNINQFNTRSWGNCFGLFYPNRTNI